MIQSILVSNTQAQKKERECEYNKDRFKNEIHNDPLLDVLDVIGGAENGDDSEQSDYYNDSYD